MEAPMKRFKIMILAALWLSGFAALEANADIYSWTDENGVNHFTNYSPPKQAKLLIKTPEPDRSAQSASYSNHLITFTSRFALYFELTS